MKWDKIGKKIIAAVFIIGLIATTAYADGNFQPGSADDPIVTKSYVDEQIALLQKKLDEQNTQNLLLLREDLLKQLKAELQNTGTAAGLKVEKLVAGQKIYGMEGTEFIVRSGDVKVIAGANGDGIPDLTGGKDLAGNATVPLNHLLLIPRTDNRGLQVVAGSRDSYIIIRGQYSITPPPAQ